jgi:dihydrolipoamide dehydrogenase
MQQFDIAIIGAGPGGYVAAIRAAQLGKKVALIEKEKTLGGTCLNVGCIPSKAMLDSSEKFDMAHHAFASHGIEVDGLKLNLKKLLARKDDVVKTLTAGIAFLMKKNRVTVFNGLGSFLDASTLKVVAADKTETLLSAANIIIATGSSVIELPHMKFDGEVIVSSTEALNFAAVPKKLVVIGAGVIGLELGSVWRRLGADVTLVDVMDRPVAMMDADISKEAQKILEKQGLKFLMGHKVVKAEVKGKKATLMAEGPNGAVTLEADKVLVAVGRKPNTEGLNLSAAGIALDERGRVPVQHHYHTGVGNIYAIGDCIQGPMLAHKAEEEGIACVERICGQAGHVNYNAISWVVYTWPEIAGVGLSEQEATAKGHRVKIGKFNFAPNGRAMGMGEKDGFVKVVADADTDRLLGVHIIGPTAGELIGEAVVAIEFTASAEDLARCVHAHPTLTEVIKEAAWATQGGAIHS